MSDTSETFSNFYNKYKNQQMRPRCKDNQE